MKTGAGQLFEPPLTLLQGDHSISGLICLIAHQNNRNIQYVVLENRNKVTAETRGSQSLTLLAEPNLRLRLL